MDQKLSYLLIPLIGYSKSGKTKSIENLIAYLTNQKYFVIALKHTGNNKFSIDTEGKNTWRYSQAGANIVSSHSQGESSFIFNSELSSQDLLNFVEYLIQWPLLNPSRLPLVVLCEGFRDLKKDHILCVQSLEDLIAQKNEYTVAISGQICGKADLIREIRSHFSIPIINGLNDPEKLINLFKFPNSN